MKLNSYSYLTSILFIIAIALSFFGIKFNHDILYFANALIVLHAWNLFHKNEGKPKKILQFIFTNIFTLSIFIAVTLYNPVNFGIKNWLPLNFQKLPISAILIILNYIILIVILSKESYKYANLSQKNWFKNFPPIFIIILSIFFLFLSFALPNNSTILQQSSVSPFIKYEKWVIDFGGSAGSRGGISCEIYKMHNFILVGKYEEFDTQKDALPTNMTQGCGA